MGINIKYKSLTFDPNTFIRGAQTNAAITCLALVDTDGDNPVKFTLEVPADSPVYFLVNGSKKKKISWEENVSTAAYGTPSIDVVVGVTAASGPISSVLAQITGKTKNNETSEDTKVIRHKNG